MGRRRGLVGDVRRLGQRPTVDDVQHGVEEEHESGAAGVDHARRGQHRQQLGRALQGLPRRHDRAVQDLHQGLVARRHRGRRRFPHDGEDRALDGVHDRLVGGIAGGGQGAGQVGPAGRRRPAQALAQPPQHLGEDDARVAPGPHQRPVADGLAGGRHVVGAFVEAGHHRLQGEGHVGAGVAVGHRVDVEPVEPVLVGPQGVTEADDAGPQVLGVEPVERLHRPDRRPPDQGRAWLGPRRGWL